MARCRNPYLQGLYNSGGTLISGTTDDDSGVGTNSQTIYIAPSSGTYYVSAAAYSSYTGTYTAVGLGGVDDHGQTAGTAGSVVVGNSVTGNIETANDQDWYGVSLVSGHTYQIDLEGDINKLRYAARSFPSRNLTIRWEVWFPERPTMMAVSEPTVR